MTEIHDFLSFVQPEIQILFYVFVLLFLLISVECKTHFCLRSVMRNYNEGDVREW